MPSPPRYLPPGYPVLVTARTEEGLPFIATALMRLILDSIMARALAVSHVKLCHYIWMGNHFHFLIVVKDPQDVEQFIGRVKTESAHAVNRLLGRRRRTIWVGDYDSVPILTFEDAEEKVRYCYLNPRRANVASSIQVYGRPSSWQAVTSGNLSRMVPWIQRSALSPELLTDKAAVEKLTNNASVSHELSISPHAWMDAFGVTDKDTQERIHKKICATVFEEELALAKTQVGTPADERPGAVQDMRRPYTPTKFSRRMWCICSDVPLRVAYILFVKTLIREGRDVLRRWRKGERAAPYPPGLPPPSFPRLATLLPGKFCAAA